MSDQDILNGALDEIITLLMQGGPYDSLISLIGRARLYNETQPANQ